VPPKAPAKASRNASTKTTPIQLAFDKPPSNWRGLLGSLVARRPTQAPADQLGVQFHATWSGVHTDPDALRAYAALCDDNEGMASVCTPAAPAPYYTFALPPLYLHAMAMPLPLAILSHPKFPLRLLGLLHTSNRIDMLRPVAPTEELTLECAMQGLNASDRGQTFDLLTTVKVGKEVVWRETSSYLSPLPPAQRKKKPQAQDTESPVWPAFVAEWSLAANAGRKFARPSGDFNPIHLSAFTARLFGFPKAIAHGMFSAARCLNLLQGQLPMRTLTFEVQFKRPLLIPGSVELVARAEGDATHFLLRGKPSQEPHLVGSLSNKISV